MITEKNTFKAFIDSEEREFEILYVFKSLKTKKDYIIYTDNKYDETNCLNIYSSIYYPEEPERELENIVSDEDWAEVENFLESMNGVENE